MTNPDIAALKAELAEMRAELAETRATGARTDAVRAEVAKRNFANPALVEAQVARQITRNENGQFVAIDENGVYRSGRAEGAYMAISEVLDEVERTNAQAVRSETTTAPKHNPFKAGPRFNITEAMALYRSNKALAVELAKDAGFNLEHIR